MLDRIDSNLAGVCIAVAFFVVGEISYRVARGGRLAADPGTRFEILQTSAFALTSLLLGFSFSVSAARFDMRRDIIVREANASAATALQAGLLDARSSSSVRALLRDYVAARIAYASTEAYSAQRFAALQRTAAMQERLWRYAQDAAHRDPQSRTIPLFILSVNATIAAGAEQAAASRPALPDFVFVILMIIVLLCAAFTGIVCARTDKRAAASMALFAIVVGLVFTAILDLNHPQRALIRVDLSPLQAVQRMPELSS